MILPSLPIVIGYCDWSTDRIIRALTDCKAKDILNARGQFVVIAQNQNDLTIITSYTGIVAYYYTLHDNSIYHGETVQSVLNSSRIPWIWNFSALADYLCLGHTVGQDTLHQDIFKTPPGSVLKFSSSLFCISYPEQVRLSSQLEAKDVLCALQEEVLFWWKKNDILCITGGFDSRLLLAVLLNANEKPNLLTCGQKDSFDLNISKQIAQKFGLHLHECQITAEDFITNQESIILRTNGLLPISHWPGVLFALHSKGNRLFLGYNGEAARSYYDNRGILALVRSNCKSQGYWAKHIWKRYFNLNLTELELNNMHPQLAIFFEQDAWLNRISRLMDCKLSMADAFDLAFQSTYTAHKTGADVAALSLFSDWIAPYCSIGWLRGIEGLHRKWKLGDSFHRYSINRLAPQLLKFPEELNPYGNTSSKQIFSQWLGLRKEPKILHFFDQKEYSDYRLINLMNSSSHALSDILSPKFIDNLSKETSRRKLYYQLSSLSLWHQLAFKR